MAIATVTFRKCILNSQEFERDDNWMAHGYFSTWKSTANGIRTSTRT